MSLLRICPSSWQPFFLDLKESFSKNPLVLFQQAGALSLVLTTFLHYLPCYNFICFVLCCHYDFQNEVFSLATSAEKWVAKTDIFIIQAFFISSHCNEVISIYKEHLHWFENFSDKEQHTQCVSRNMKWQCEDFNTGSPAKFSLFWKAEYIFCKVRGLIPTSLKKLRGTAPERAEKICRCGASSGGLGNAGLIVGFD